MYITREIMRTKAYEQIQQQQNQWKIEQQRAANEAQAAKNQNRAQEIADKWRQHTQQVTKIIEWAKWQNIDTYA